MNETHETTDLRVITEGGELVDYTAHTEESDAWVSFEAVIPNLQEGEIAQLIQDDLIVAEHNPEYHGTVALDVTDYS